MSRHNQTTFYLEQLQPSWLTSTWLQRLYDWSVVCFPAIFTGLLVSIIIVSFFQIAVNQLEILLGFGIPSGLLGYLLSRKELSPSSHVYGEISSNTSWQHPFLELLRASSVGPAYGLAAGLLSGVPAGVLIGIPAGLIYGLLHNFLGKMSGVPISPLFIGETGWHWLFKHRWIYYGLFYGTLTGLAYGLLANAEFGLVRGLVVGMIAGIVSGGITALVYGLVSQVIHALLRVFEKVETSWQVPFSTRKIRRSWLITNVIAETSSTPFSLRRIRRWWLFSNIGVHYGLVIGPTVGLLAGLVGGVRSGLLAGLLSGLVVGLSFSRNRAVRYGLVIGLVFGLVIGLIYGLIYALIGGFVTGLDSGLGYGLLIGLTFGLIMGVVFGSTGGVLSILLVKENTTIQPTDRLVWSWRKLRKGLFSKQRVMSVMQNIALFASLAGLGTILLGQAQVFTNKLFYAKQVSSLPFSWYALVIVSLAFGLSYWLLLGLFEGVSGETIEDQERNNPNEGIYRSARNGAILGIISFLVVEVISLFILLLSHNVFHVSFLRRIANPNDWWMTEVILGLGVGLLVALFHGWLACLRHYVLRLLLWRAGYIPWNYRSYLEEAARRVVLYQVGGGFIFMHRLLLDHIARMESAESPLLAMPGAEQKPT